MGNTCHLHAGHGRFQKRNRLKYDEVIGQIHYNHSKPGRDRCAYCAYEAGQKAGYARAIEDLAAHYREIYGRK